MRKQNTRKDIIVRDNRHYKKLRVIHDNDNLGVMDTQQALDRAWRVKSDLILINETSDPPVAKILNANKFKYEQKLREKELARKQRQNKIVLKEVQFRLGIGDHDFDVKLKNIHKFLDKGNKVKCVLRYKGRENANKQIGFELMDRVLAASGGEWDTKPAINSNRMIGVLMRKE